MTRKFLEGIEGLNKDAIDKIMQENGNDINTAKKDHDAIAEKLKTTEGTLSTLQGELTTLKESTASGEYFKAKFEELQQKIAADEQEAKAKADDAALTERIQKSFGDKKFTSDYVKNGITSDMKSELAKAENNGKSDAEIFAALTTDKQGIFESVHPAAQMSGINSAATGTDAAQAAAKAFPTKSWNKTNF